MACAVTFTTGRRPLTVCALNPAYSSSAARWRSVGVASVPLLASLADDHVVDRLALDELLELRGAGLEHVDDDDEVEHDVPKSQLRPVAGPMAFVMILTSGVC